MIGISIAKLRPEAILPAYAHGSDADAGMDLCAVERFVLYKDEPKLVRTGIAIQLPPGFEGQIRSRSGLALKYGVSVLNAPGTIDPSYRGEIGVILIWNGFKGNHKEDHCFYIEPGDRIAQLVISQYSPVVWNLVPILAETQRGEGGFGSTGVGSNA